MFGGLPAFRHWFGPRALFQAIAFASAEGLGVLGLSGVIDTPVQYGILLAVGLLALFAWFDAAKKEKESEQQRNQIDSLLEQLQMNLLAPHVPLHLQNLSNLSHDRLRNLIDEASAKARDFERANRRGASSLHRIDWSKLDDQSMHILWKAECDASTEKHYKENTEFQEKYRPELLALWNEVVRRTSPPTNEENATAIAITKGVLGGPYPIDWALSILAKKAAELPND